MPFHGPYLTRVRLPVKPNVRVEPFDAAATTPDRGRRPARGLVKDPRLMGYGQHGRRSPYAFRPTVFGGEQAQLQDGFDIAGVRPGGCRRRS
jgi:hypothetical protein